MIIEPWKRFKPSIIVIPDVWNLRIPTNSEDSLLQGKDLGFSVDVMDGEEEQSSFSCWVLNESFMSYIFSLCVCALRMVGTFKDAERILLS